MSIYVACQCGQAFAAEPRLSGTTVACPACRRPLTIPHAVPTHTNTLPSFDNRTFASPVSPATASNDDSPWLAIGGIAVAAVVVLALIGMAIFSNSRGGTPQTPVASEAVPPKLVVSSPVAENKDWSALPPIRTPQELKSYYSIATGETDATKVWLAALRRFRPNSIRSSPVTTGDYPGPGNPWPAQIAASQFVAAHRADIAELFKAANQPGRVRFPTEFHRGCMMPLPHATLVRDAVELMEINAYVVAHNNNAQATLDSIHAIYAATATLERYPAAVALLVKVGCSPVADRGVIDCLPRLQFSNEQLLLLEQDLARQSNLQDLRDAFIGEKVITTVDFDQPAVYYDQLDVQKNNNGPFGAATDSITKQWFVSRDSTRDRQFCERSFDNTLVALRPPFANAYSEVQSQLKGLEWVRAQPLPERMQLIGSSFHLPVIKAALIMAAFAEASRGMTRAAIGVERYRRDNPGTFPATLDEMVPKYLAEIPIDPFDGKPIRYRPGSTNALLYSVGTDGIDNGGTTSPKREPDFSYTIDYK